MAMIVKAKQCHECNAISTEKHTHCYKCNKYLGEYGERGAFDAGFCQNCNRWVGGGVDSCYACGAIAPWASNYRGVNNQQISDEKGSSNQQQASREKRFSSKAPEQKKSIGWWPEQKKDKGWW